MTRFEVFKFLHVMGAIVWLGSGIGLFLLSVRMRTAGDRAGIVGLGRHSAWLGNTLFMPASLATIVFGVLMVATMAAFSFADLWIVIGLVGVVASSVLAMGVMGPAEKRFMEMAEELGTDHLDVDAQLGKILRLNAVDLGILAFVTWAMVAKPGA